MIRSIRSKIALWHVVMFVAMSLVSSFLIYNRLHRYLHLQIDDVLLETVKRNEWYGNNQNEEVLTGHIEYYMQIEGIHTVYYSVFNPDGEVFSKPMFEHWKEYQADPEWVRIISGSDKLNCKQVEALIPGIISKSISNCPGTNHVFLDTIDFKNQDLRICYARLRDGRVLLSIHSLEQTKQFLSELIQTFWSLFGLTVLLGGIAGWFLANKSVSGVKKVTQFASGIKEGSFHHRLDAAGYGIEIEDLATQFNSMLDKIQSLLQTLGNVSDDIAHDLRTPITRIRGTAEMALTSNTPDPQLYESSFCSIIEECDRLVVIIKTMLEITQTDSGVVEMQKEIVDLKKVISDGYQLFKPLAEDKQISFNWEFDCKHAYASVNLTKFQRAVSNLIDNSIKFTPQNGKIDIRGESTDSSIFIHIEDNGIGIPAGEHAKVFDRFYRSDPSRTIEGNGLGLSLARAIIQAHSGKITLTSTPNQGSCFTITIPQATHSKIRYETYVKNNSSNYTG